MSNSKKSIRQQKTQILQKDLSFSNEIFRKSFNADQLRSNKESEQNFYKTIIPPLIKYTDQPDSILYKQNLTQDISSLNQKRSQTDINSYPLNIFTKNKIFGSNFNDQKSNLQLSEIIPPLSQLEEIIFKKYKRNNDEKISQIQNTPQNEQNNSKVNSQQAKVYFDKTYKLEEPILNRKNSAQNMVDIDSLQESRIANDSIEKQNHWLLTKISQSSQLLDDKIQKNNKPRNSFALSNQSFRRFNPLNLVNNSLHTSNLPEFIEDDDSISENRSLNNEINLKEHETNLMNLQKFQREINDKNLTYQFSNIKSTNNDRKNISFETPFKRKQKSIQQITLGLFSHFLQGFFMHHIEKDKEDITEEGISSILINQPSESSGFDNLTSKSSPIYTKFHQREIQNNNKSMSETDNFAKNFDLSIDSFSPQNSNQNFIRDKNSQEIIASLLKDVRKAKIFIKYLQIKISENSQNSDICKNYELLSCIIKKIQQIVDKKITNKFPIALAQSILQVYTTSRKSQINQRQRLKSLKPQVIRTKDQIKIDFDPYLKSEKIILNQKILNLKKAIEEKNKSTELIKLTYDGIVHNYAITLENLAKKAQDNFFEPPKQLEGGKQQSSMVKNQIKFNFSDKFQPNSHPDILSIYRSSVEGNGIHRKATFGKAPSSSFGGSDNHDF